MKDHAHAKASTTSETEAIVAADWATTYARLLTISDLLVLVWVVFGVQIAWLGFDISTDGYSQSDITISYTAVSVLIVAGWMVILSAYGTRVPRVVGAGSAEYKLVSDGAMRLFGIVAILAFLFKVDLARGYILIAFPMGLGILLLSRWMWRQWLGVQRLRGGYSSKVLLVGSLESASAVAVDLIRSPAAGYKVVGACLPTRGSTQHLIGTSVPVVGSVENALEMMMIVGADTIVITSADELSPSRVRELSWALEPGRQHLVVAPSLTDIGGPRIHTRPVAGLPLIHVETPRYDGGKRFTKRAFDLIGASALLTLLAPLFVAVGLSVKLTSAGPVFYKQERIGKNAQAFNMLKFRSMEIGADARLEELLEEQGTSNRPLFKVKNDPRVTKIGGFLRRYSLDELPQLINVLRGDMSLVGPRPQREGEVALYDNAARRRLIVQPGMTGLWQVSGRSTLSWEDSIRLDLYYVENWSLTADLSILWRTTKAVIAPGSSAH